MAYYGKYREKEKYSGVRSDGTTYSGQTPSGYYGTFKGHVTDIDGNKLHDISASDYFLNLQTNEDELNFETWNIINDQLSEFAEKHMPSDEESHHWQCGFGGDEGDGIIDFFCRRKVKIPPPMIFEVYGKRYEMTWTYSGDSDRD